MLWDADGNEIERRDASGAGGTEAITVNGVIPGEDYIVSVFAHDYDSSGSFDLLIDFHIPTLGDFNNDELFNCADVDGLVATIVAGTNDLSFDMNGDLAVDQDDLDAWLATAGAANLASGNPYLRGDANLDGNVNGADFVIWNNNKFASGVGWCGADFNADGTTNGQDFVIWNNNKFMSAIAFAAGPNERLDLDAVVQNDDRAWQVEEAMLADAMAGPPIQLKASDLTAHFSGSPLSRAESAAEHPIDQLFAEEWSADPAWN